MSKDEVSPLGLPGYGGVKVFTEPVMSSNTAVLVLAANPRRAVAEIQNVGTTTVWLGKDGTVTPTHGQKLAAGANYTDERSLDAWYGYSDTGVGDIRVLEVTQ